MGSVVVSSWMGKLRHGAQRCRLITDGGRSEKERDAEGSGESGGGKYTVLYIVPGARQISALGALACMVQSHVLR